jgi:hypothetical protein
VLLFDTILLLIELIYSGERKESFLKQKLELLDFKLFWSYGLSEKSDKPRLFFILDKLELSLV